MLLGQRVAVVVPAYREAPRIARVLRTMPAYVDDVVVVDDGSDDGTADAAQALGDARVRVLRHGANHGVGAAIRTGYAAAFEAGAQVAAVMAGDAQMDPADLRSLVTPVVLGDADYVKGDRLGHSALRAQMPLSRRVGNRVLSVLTRLATGLPIHDSQCGYTALGAAAHARLPWGSLWRGYGYPNDLLGHLVQQGARVQEVRVSPIYADEVSGVRLHHALFVVPFILLRVALRARRRGVAREAATGSACASGY